jgi:hypothetical protein
MLINYHRPFIGIVSNGRNAERTGTFNCNNALEQIVENVHDSTKTKLNGDLKIVFVESLWSFYKISIKIKRK